MVVDCNGSEHSNRVIIMVISPMTHRCDGDRCVQNYQAAEEAFMQVLKLDSKCEDARQELNVVRTNQLVVSIYSHSVL